MPVSRHAYRIKPIIINGKKIVQVVIDPHYQIKHSGSINDELILKLVAELDGRRELPETKQGVYAYFATLIELDGKQYRYNLASWRPCYLYWCRQCI